MSECASRTWGLPACWGAVGRAGRGPRKGEGVGPLGSARRFPAMPCAGGAGPGRRRAGWR
eukprot:6068221-Prymnesium_polylepis.2